MDVKSTFPNGILEEEVFFKQPLGFVKKGSEEKVYKLKKAPYELKQAPRVWNKPIGSFFHKTIFQNDLIFIDNNLKIMKDFKKSMMYEFKMKDLGLIYYFLGIEMIQGDDRIFIYQKRYATELLKKF